MENIDRAHLLIAIIINLILVGLLIKMVENGNDMYVVLFFVLYPIIILANGIIWGILDSRNNPKSKIYMIITLGLGILFLPILIITG